MTFRPASTASAPNGSRTSGESVVGDNPGELIHEDGVRAILAPPGNPSPTGDGSSLGSHESQQSTWMGSQGRDIPQECLLDILPPSVPRVPTPTLHPLQEWEGCVTEIRSDDFVADLLDLTAGDAVEAEEAVIPKDELSPEDRARLAIGSLFWWVVGYEASVGGARKRVSQIVFPDLPPMTEADLDRGRDWADWLYERWGLE